MTSLISRTTVALLSVLSVVSASPIDGHSTTELVSRNVLGAIPSSADLIEYKVQPVLDFDRDGCYNTAAIDGNGNTNGGLNSLAKCPADDCRNKDRLDNNNVYSRKRCNNGWCAIMYEYYFEKDQAICGSFLGGHRHDWENVVVFTQGNSVKWVSPSCHGKYEHGSGSPRTEGIRPKMVFHKDGAGTHCFRHANPSDDSIENHTGRWFTGKLIGWDHWPNTGLRDKMLNNWSGGIGPKLDNEFGDSLKAAAGNNVPGFNPFSDS